MTQNFFACAIILYDTSIDAEICKQFDKQVIYFQIRIENNFKKYILLKISGKTRSFQFVPFYNNPKSIELWTCKLLDHVVKNYPQRIVCQIKRRIVCFS